MSKKTNRRVLKWAALFVCSAALIVFVIWPKDIGGSCLCAGNWDYKTDSFAVCDKQVIVDDVILKEYPSTNKSNTYGRCTQPGIHYRSQNCLGVKDQINFITGIGTSYLDLCMGIPIGQMQCFGMPVTGTVSHEYIPLPCDYPYSDKTIIEMCKDQDFIKFDDVSVNCSAMRQGK
jgi:hypothetical protein